MLAAGNAVRSTVLPSSAHMPFNLALAGGMAVAATGSGLTTAELGLARRDLPSGLRWGGAAAGVVTLVVVTASLVPPASGALDDERAAVELGDLLYDLGVRIPLGTVLVEELAFRAVMLPLLSRLVPLRTAVLVSSVLFGLWHVLPASGAVDANAALSSITESTGGTTVVVAGTVVATTGAGVALCWLRLGSGSLAAPSLAHLATNTVPLATAWVLTR
jgi:membrane protease YdiL (CAAX protease family)